MKEIVMRSPLKGLPSKREQKGAVAIIFGLVAVVLLSMGGLVLDMGHLYIAKAELQNAADAAALAGAKRLDETAAGITNARNDAIAIAALNNFDFATPLTITGAHTEFSSNPGGPWVSYATAFASPAGMTFVKVDTGARTLPTYLMSVAGIYSVSTFGLAVAGRFVVNVTPLGVCAIDPDNVTSVKANAAGVNELVELGFRRGITYNILDLGPLGATGVPMLLNPVDSPPTACDPSHSSANFTAPFICQGNSAVGVGTSVYANTGGSYGPIQRAFNSRFDDFPGGTACDPTTSPPDSNVKDYLWDLASGAGGPKDWMNPDPIQQSITINPGTAKPLNWPANPPTSGDFGTLWSYSPAVRATGSSPNYTAGTPFAPSDWADLYNPSLTAPGYPSSAAIPPFPAGTQASPYNQITGNYFGLPPTHPPGTRNRRLINIVIVDCAGIGGGGLSCAQLPVKGIGRFFLQTRTELAGSPKTIYSEFAGLIEPVPVSEIKLYR
jgi:Flp pilus assembly protein TadG